MTEYGWFRTAGEAQWFADRKNAYKVIRTDRSLDVSSLSETNECRYTPKMPLKYEKLGFYW